MADNDDVSLDITPPPDPRPTDPEGYPSHPADGSAGANRRPAEIAAPLQTDATPVAPDASPAFTPRTPIQQADDEYIGVQRALLTQSLQQAAKTSPQAHADLLNLSSQSHMSPSVAAGEPDMAKQEAAIQGADVNTLVVRHPELAQWLSNADNASVAQHDIPRLKTLDDLINATPAGPTGVASPSQAIGLPPGFVAARDGSILEPTKDGLANSYKDLDALVQHFQDLGDRAVANELAQQLQTQRFQQRLGIIPVSVGAGAAGSVSSWQHIFGTNEPGNDDAQELMAASLRADPGFGGTVMRMGGQLAADLPLLLAGGPFGRIATSLADASRISALTGETTGRMLTHVATEAGAQAPLSAKQGLEEASEGHHLQGLADFLGNSTIFGFAGRNPFTKAATTPLEEAIAQGGIKGTVGRLFKEAGMQYGAGVASVYENAANQQIFGDGNVDWDQVHHAAIQQGLAGGLAATVFGLHPTLAAKYRADAEKAVAASSFADRQRMAREQLADSTLQQVSPGKASDAIQAVQGTHPQMVFAQSMAWQEHWLAEGKDPVAEAEKLGLGDQYTQARATNADMAIPWDKWLQATVSSTKPQNLEKVAREQPGAMNQEESAEFYKKTPEEIAAKTAELRQQAVQLSSGMDQEEGQKIQDEKVAELSASHPEWTEAKIQELAKFSRYMFQAIAANHNRDIESRGGARISALEESRKVRFEGPHGAGDAIDQALTHLTTGKQEPGTITPELQKIVDAIQEHADSIGTSITDKTKAGLGDELRAMMAKRQGMTLEQPPIPVPESGDLGRRSLAATWAKEHGGQEPSPNDPVWRKLLANANLVDQATDNPVMKALDEYESGRGQLTVQGRKIVIADVPYGAGMSQDGKTVYIDRRIPRFMEVDGKRLNVHELIADHEIDEHGHMAQGESYGASHDQAVKVENHDADRKAGISHADYQKIVAGPVARARKLAKPEGIPADLEEKPYHDMGELNLIKDRSGPTADGQVSFRQGGGEVSFNQSVYHGTGNATPYDRLDVGKVNAEGGEGSQDHGHGIYVTESKEAGKFYRTQNSALMRGPGHYINELKAYFTPGREVKSFLGSDKVISFNENKGGSGWTVTVKDARDKDARERTHSTDPTEKELDSFLKAERPDLLEKRTKYMGRLYHLDIPDAGWLAYERDLSDQPKDVQDAVGRAAHAAGVDSKGTGAYVYGAISRQLGGDRAASEALAKEGVHGIKYRGDEGEGPYHNYVVFHNDAMAIVRYEQPARGSINYDANGNATISLGPDSDPSTVAHELFHYAFGKLGELAQRVDASPGVQKDYQQMLTFSGLGTHENNLAMAKEIGELQAQPSLTTEEQAHLAELVKPYEKLAEAGETYVMTGKAPIPELRGTFRRIAMWMADVYKRIKFLGVKLNPEITAVFDRLLASQESIDKARAEMGDEPMFKSAAEAGWTQERYDAYVKSVTDMKDREEQRLEEKVIGEPRNKIVGEQRELATEQVNSQPAYRALHALQRGLHPDGTEIETPIKLDRAEIVRTYGEIGLKRLPGRNSYSLSPNKGQPIYRAEGGVPLDVAARTLGFQSGDDLYQALINAPDRNQLIEQTTQQLVAQKYPDLDATSVDRAVEVLHSDERSRLIMTTLDSLGKRIGQTPAPVELLRKVAQETIANQRVELVTPDIYRHGEAKAAREVLKAMASEDWSGAFAAQQRRLLNAELFRAAKDAKERITDFGDYQRRFDEPKVRAKLIKAGNGSTEFTGVIDSIRNTYGLSRRPPGETPNEFIARRVEDVRQSGQLPSQSADEMGISQKDFMSYLQHIAGVDIPDSVANAKPGQQVKNLSVHELDDLSNALHGIEQTARNEGRSLINDRHETWQAMTDELTAQLVASSRGDHKVVTNPGLLGKSLNLVNSFFAWHRNLSAIAERYDGYKRGIWFDTVVRPLHEAADAEHGMHFEDAQVIEKLIRESGIGDNLGTLYHRKLMPEVGEHLSLMNRIMIGLNSGSVANVERLRTGHGWTKERHQAVLDTLDASHQKLIEGIWAHFQTRFPALKAQEMRLFGREIEERERAPLTMQGRTSKGGYFPIRYDPKASARGSDLEAASTLQEQRGGSYGAAKSRDSMTKKVSATTGRRLLLSEESIYRSLDDLAHRLTHEDTLSTLRRVLMNKDIKQTMVEQHGIENYNMMRDAITDVARGTEQLNGFWKGVNHLRTGVASAQYSFNYVRGLLDLFESVPQATSKVGPAYLLKSSYRYLSSAVSMEGTAKQIDGLSPMMAARRRIDLRGAQDAFQSTKLGGDIRHQVEHYGRAAMHAFHTATDDIVWLGAHDQALKEHYDDPAKAIAIADATVRDTMSGHDVVDMAKIQRGNELMKMLTVGYGFFAKTMQAQSAIWGRARLANTPQAYGRAFVSYLMLYSLPVAIDMALKGALRGNGPSQQNDTESLMKRFVKEHIAYGLSTSVPTRLFTGAVEGPTSQYQGAGGERGVQALYDLIRHVSNWQTKGLSKVAVDAAGPIFHIPSAAIDRVLSGYEYASENDKNPIAPMLFGRPPKH